MILLITVASGKRVRTTIATSNSAPAFAIYLSACLITKTTTMPSTKDLRVCTPMYDMVSFFTIYWKSVSHIYYIENIFYLYRQYM